MMTGKVCSFCYGNTVCYDFTTYTAQLANWLYILYCEKGTEWGT